MTGASARRPIHLLGAGRAVVSLARLLARAGHPIGAIVNRSIASATAAARTIGAGTATADSAAAFASGAITLIGLREGGLATIAERVATTLAPQVGSVALHTSGALPAGVLAPLRSRGVAIGSLHPAASFASREVPLESLAGVTFDLEGDEAARVAARELVAALGGRVLELADGDAKVLFHAAACVAANALVALLGTAERIAAAGGVEPLLARAALLALAATSCANVARQGSTAALTGPIERGEADVIARHLEALGRRAPHELPRYRELALATLDAAERKGSVDAAALTALRALLAPRAPG